MIWLILLLAVGYGTYIAYTEYASGLYYLAGRYDRMMNPYGIDPEAPEPSEEDRKFHRSMFVADMHADTLKWERDLLERSNYGHADVPRMMEGNIALQGFTIVTKSPIRMPWSNCVGRNNPDANTLLTAMQGRPVFNLHDRAFYQIERFKDAVERSKETPGPELRLIETVEDLKALVADRKAGKAVIGGFLGIEGGHWVGGALEDGEAVRADMQELFDAGVRMFAPNHRFDNDLSGSNEGCEAYGLTERGRMALQEAERLGMAVDLAHISQAGLRDAAEMLERPFTVSHTGVRANCEDPCRPHRNLSDEEIELIIQNDGVIGVGFWPQAIGPSVWRIADTMAHIMRTAEQMGRERSRHVALGSDYDGSVTPLIRVGNLDVLTTIMRRRDEPFSPDEIRNISGRNVCRLLATVLPGGSRETARELCAELDEVEPVPLQEAGGGSLGGGAGSAGGLGDAGSASFSGDSGSSLASGSLLSNTVTWIARSQSALTNRLHGQLHGAPSGAGFGGFAIILASFVYGLLHAAGPGHGKVVAGAYFLANPGRPAQAIGLSAAMAFLQAASAIVIVTALLLVAGTTISQLTLQAKFVEALAYGLILLLGLAMLLRCVTGRGTCSACADHGGEPGQRPAGQGGRLRDYAALAVGVGLRPCSGALLLLLFTLAAGMFHIGVVATLAMALGSAITISLSALGAISVRHGVSKLALNAGGAAAVQRFGPMAARGAEAFGGLLIAAAGALFLAAAILRMGHL